MDLYFAYNCMIYRRRWGTDYIDEPINGAKVVACPFCGVSTSSGEILSNNVDYVYFKCFTCERFALSSRSIIRVTKEEVEKSHPHLFVADDVRFHLTRIYKIVSITTAELMRFTKSKYMTNDDVIAFYSDLKKFGDENKVNVDGFVDFDVADKFLKSNELAQKYKIEYSRIANEYLYLPINDYSLSNIPFRGTISVTFVDGNDDKISTWVNYIS